jgi:hypothetical protein
MSVTGCGPEKVGIRHEEVLGNAEHELDKTENELLNSV